MRGFENRRSHTFDIAVMREKELAVLCCDVGDVTWLWANVESRSTNTHDVVDLARMDYPYKLFSHHYDVQVGG